MKQWVIGILCVLIASLISRTALCASTDFAIPLVRVKGQIKDDAGGLLSDVAVTLKNKTGEYRAKTGDDGTFEISIPEGAYDVTAEIQGCQRYKRKHFVAQGEKEMRIDVVLKCAATPIYDECG